MEALKTSGKKNSIMENIENIRFTQSSSSSYHYYWLQLVMLNEPILPCLWA